MTLYHGIFPHRAAAMAMAEAYSASQRDRVADWAAHTGQTIEAARDDLAEMKRDADAACGSDEYSGDWA